MQRVGRVQPLGRLFGPGENRVGEGVLPAEHERAAEQQQCRGTPRAGRGQSGERELDVDAHLVDAVAAQRRVQERDRRLDGGFAVGSALGGGEPALGRGRSPAERVQPASRDGDRRIALELRLVELLEPVFDVVDPAAVVGRERDRGHDPRHPVGVGGSFGVEERGFEVAVCLEPVRRPAVELGGELGLVLAQLACEQVPEERMTAVGLAVPVERREQQGHAVERSQHAS